LWAVAPNSSTIYQDDLPWCARNPGRKTEYDLFLSDLAERGVKAVDLRPALKAARSQGKVYLRHDSHWTPRGAIAGYNAVVEADGHPDWRVDPATALGPPTLVKGGDLARLAGVQDQATETVEPLTPPVEGRRRTNLHGRDAGPRCCDRQSRKDRHGDRRFVYGLLFHANVVRASERVVWIHHHQCGFDWRLIDKFHPDEVWWAPTERFLICDPGARPIHFPDPAISSRAGG
jgi:alginate O-acetyltransferase complex protein AlgJ